MKSHASDSIKIPPGLWAGLSALGISALDVARKAQLPLAVITEQQAVADSHYFAMWRAYSELIGDTAQGIVKLTKAVAGELGMSDRTLQRRLSLEGTSFKQLLTRARHEQAREYLADPSIAIKEVAFLIGYEDQNSF